jgi:DNA-binding LacI/PurR family transcriptional regulator
MALAGVAVAQRTGLSVPRDLSVSGFDDSDIARYVYPSLTSVATDAVEWGAVAARSLLASIAGVPLDDTEMAPARLVIRESTGPVPRSHPPR